MQIETIITNRDGEVIAKKTALDWEGAEENLGKLQRYCFEKERQQIELQDEIANRNLDNSEN